MLALWVFIEVNNCGVRTSREGAPLEICAVCVVYEHTRWQLFVKRL